MKIIPLNPPFSKGEKRYPPLEKGGKGGFERLFSDELFLNSQRRLPDISMPFFIRQYLFHHKPASWITQFIKKLNVRLVLSYRCILTLKIILHHLYEVSTLFNLRRSSRRIPPQVINPLCNHLHVFHLIAPDLLK